MISLLKTEQTPLFFEDLEKKKIVFEFLKNLIGDKSSEYFNKETLSDMKLIVKNSGHSFQLHKVILYSRSEFFRKLIEINPHEKVYEIDDDKWNLKLFTCLVFVLSFSNEMKFTLSHTKHKTQSTKCFIDLFTLLFVCLYVSVEIFVFRCD
jgi:hypothetical protein